jgi:uridylate kinase
MSINHAEPHTASPAARRRVLLKLSGEALMGEHSFGIDPEMLRDVAHTLSRVAQDGIELGVVVGGGNLSRGV